MIDTVSPFPFRQLPSLWRWIDAHRNRFCDDYFAKDLNRFVDEWEALEANGRRSWGVRRDGQLGGVVTAQQLGPMVWDFHVIFSPDFMGHDTTFQGLGLVLEQIFSPAVGAEKLTTMMFADNSSTASLIRKWGVRREGLLRKHTRRNGELVDLALLGLRKEDFHVIWNQQRKPKLDVEHEPTGTATPQLANNDQQQFVGIPEHAGDAERIDAGDAGRIDGANTEPGTVRDSAAPVQCDPAVNVGPE